MDSQGFNNLPLEQKQEYIQVLREDLLPIFKDMVMEHPLFALVQAWISIPMAMGVESELRYNASEETQAIALDRYRMATFLSTLIVNMHIINPHMYRSANIHLSFQNTDGTKGSIVIDNFEVSENNYVDCNSIKVVSC